MCEIKNLTVRKLDTFVQFFVISILQLLIYALLLLEKIHHTPKTFNETTKLQIDVFEKKKLSENIQRWPYFSFLKPIFQISLPINKTVASNGQNNSRYMSRCHSKISMDLSNVVDVRLIFKGTALIVWETFDDVRLCSFMWLSRIDQMHKYRYYRICPMCIRSQTMSQLWLWHL